MSASESQACPRCGSEEVTAGRFLGSSAAAFFPAGLRWLSLKARGLALPFDGLRGGQGAACLGCGLVWSEVDPARLRAVIRAAGTDAARQRLGGEGGA